jgi:hypothetical protein
MTGHAVGAERQEVFRGKWFIDLQVTISARVLVERRSIAFDVTIFTCKSCAITLGLMRREQERGCAVVKSGRTPASRRVTGSTLISERACVRVIFDMAGGAVHGRPFEDIVLMAICAGNRAMFSIKMESERGMIYVRGLPAFRRMTSRALIAKLTCMRIILGMTGSTIL